MNEEKGVAGFIILLVLIIVGGLFWAVPVYSRYQAVKYAENKLTAQQFLKQVAVAQAEAKNDSAKYEAQAEVTRAEGVAKANAIIGESLKNNEAYLRYLWISNMNDQEKEIIYIPTEANLPILEASRNQTK